MSDGWPKFRVFAVKDGEAYGLLVKRQRSEIEPEETKYFWLRAAHGLAPTREVHGACNICHELSPSVYNQRFVALLVGYTEAVAQTGHLQVGLGLVSKYRSVRDYQGIIDHFFERGDAELKDFFVRASTFKEKIVRKIRGKDELVGKADEFRVLSPHDAVAIGSGYFKPIAHVLRVGYGKPEWFRREGPLAVDFDAGLVYRRDALLVQLKELVLGNHISLLEGLSATGKTVLVRQLGYELSQRDRLPVYWFDGAVEQGFDKDQLIREINSARGMFIIENIHLETRKYQRVYYSIRPDPHRHILFTGRSSFRESEDPNDWPLSTLDNIVLTPFDEVDDIIQHFVAHHADARWSQRVRESIKCISRRDFWLLSHALKGYVAAHGRGKPKDWVAKGVRDNLCNLGYTHSEFPECLVALSPLYKHEVMTEEGFLVRGLGLSQKTLDALVYRGEATRRPDDEGRFVFYGLPHSALADLYWEHGDQYRRRRGFPECDDFVYEYAISGVSNGLEAIASTNYKTSKRLLSRLLRSEHVHEVVRRETSVPAVHLGRDCPISS